MNIIEESFRRLYPEKNFTYYSSIKYNGKFRPFNSNIKLRGNNITLNLSRNWKDIDDEIKIGLVQELLIKLFKSKKHTKNMDMYNSFIKNLHNFVPKTQSDPLLENSFNRVNEKYFSGTIEKPNLRFGSRSFSKLGSYEYATDTIMLSSVLKDDFELLDYVMYHEMLHKRHKFSSKNGRNYHHTSDFREKEKQFINADLMERRLKRLRLKEFIPFRRFGWFRR
jgi:predicted metal-dependent hydrolase